MAQYDYYEYRGPNSAVAFLLDIQSDLLRDLAMRVVIPLIPLDAFGPPLKKLNPVLQIGGRPYVLATIDMAGTSTRNLGELAGNLDAHRTEIKGAIDFMQDGF